MHRYCKRLIEVDLPIKRISAHARREKSIRHGHISTLHIWWARRPLAACRAVICAALWPDPADELYPEAFREAARTYMHGWAAHHLTLASEDSYSRFVAIQKESRKLDDNIVLRQALLDFIADFANWDNSTVKEYLDTSRALTQAAHEALGGAPGTKPLVVDPFAGGGSIPLEALRVGADAFASELNPVAVLLNKVVLEYIPKYGQRLAHEVRKWGEWVKREAEKELAEFYPQDADGATPIAYLWARTIQCEGPGCGAEVPLVKTTVLDSKPVGKDVRLAIEGNESGQGFKTQILYGKSDRNGISTVRGWSVTCPLCGFTTAKKHVQFQLTQQNGGASSARLLAVVTSTPGKSGKRFRNPTHRDVEVVENAKKAVLKPEHHAILASLSAEFPNRDAHRAVGSQLPLYGLKRYEDVYLARQKLALACLGRAIQRIPNTGSEFDHTIRVLMAFCLAKQADYSTTLCRWRPDGAYVNPTLGGEKKYVMVSDFAESCPLSHGSGDWLGQVDWVGRALARESILQDSNGQVAQASADSRVLPDDSADAVVTDPPYYDSVPYSDLANFFYVWLRPLLQKEFPELLEPMVSPKQKEMTVDHPGNDAETANYRDGLTRAFDTGRFTTKPAGIGVIVFAHKSTAGWESLLAAIIQAGWSIVASWPVDTELQNRLNARGTASLSSSVHIVCRPRENPDGSVRTDEIGDWRDVLQELPRRIHEWMPRLAEEGVVGADAIFACLGPALEIYSRYSSVEKASGEHVSLKEYLEEVWAAVAREALIVIFEGADVSGFEADARLTAMWLWTLRTLVNGADDDVDEDSEEEGETTKNLRGYSLEYDAARKIAQGLGAHLENLSHLVEIKGDTATLLSAGARTRYLFGKESAEAPKGRGKKPDRQLTLNFEGELHQLEEEARGWGEDLTSRPGLTVLDRLHQSMLLFATGRSGALQRFLVEDGVGRNELFWRLAQALSALYPTGTDEKRWVDGVLARKRSLGF
jgi:adenine-specific DNA methylase